MLGNHAKAPENKLEDPDWACFSGDVFFLVHSTTQTQPLSTYLNLPPAVTFASSKQKDDPGQHAILLG